jgi:hypothetical protein
MAFGLDAALPLEGAETRGVLLLASAEFLDVATTLIGLRSGQFIEGNPVAAGLLARTDLLMALKLLLAMAVMLIVRRHVSPGRRAPVLMVMAFIAMSAPLWNATHMLAGG